MLSTFVKKLDKGKIPVERFFKPWRLDGTEVGMTTGNGEPSRWRPPIYSLRQQALLRKEVERGRLLTGQTLKLEGLEGQTSQNDAKINDAYSAIIEYTGKGERRPLRIKPPKLHKHERTRREKAEKIALSMQEMEGKIREWRESKSQSRESGRVKRGSFGLS